MAKLRLKTDCGTSYLRLGAELDIDVPGDPPEAVKAAAGPMLDALRDACEDALSRYRAELAGDLARTVPELEHKRGCTQCPAPSSDTKGSGAGGTIETGAVPAVYVGDRKYAAPISAAPTAKTMTRRRSRRAICWASSSV